MFAIKPFHLSDLPTILQIESDIQAYPWTEKMFTDCLNDNQYEGFILEQKNNHQPCAYLITQLIVDECHLLTLGVKKSMQKQGLAIQFLAFLIEHQKKNSHRILLEVAASNIPAIGLYKKAGFQQIGIRKSYYQSTCNERSDNALVFEKLLN